MWRDFLDRAASPVPEPGRPKHALDKGKPGEFLWFEDQWEHLPENLNNKNFEAIYVELKT